ncbi:MAG: hypothetical protein PF488_02015 [Patescibacteria group bacterium]|jgi:hypothetical protein|nr:hypothetical protein [Patescibacteria group bacterium]
MENKKNKPEIDPEILNAADFLAIGEDYNENDGVMIDGQVVSDRSDKVKIEEEKEDKKREDAYISSKYYNEKSFKRMRWGVWLAENRKNIVNTIIILLIIMSSFFFIYSIYNLIVYFNSDNPVENTTDNNLILENKSKPEKLQLSGVTRFSSVNSDDLVAAVLNPNDNYNSTFTYCFTRGKEDIDCQKSFVLPGEEKHIFSLGIELLAGGSLPEIELRDVSFKSVDNKRIPDFEVFKNKRLNFPITELDFSPASSRVSNVIDLNNLSFTITNNTPYGYYEVPLNILIYNGLNIIGVNRYVIDGFKSGESKDIDLSWPGDLRNGTGVEIVAELNVLNGNIYSAYKGE